MAKQIVISLRDCSHEVCVAATQSDYWRQLIGKSSVRITCRGKFVPKECNAVCSEATDPRLQLILAASDEMDDPQVDPRIHHDLSLFNRYDEPVYDVDHHRLLVFGSLFNSLPVGMFDFERTLLGEQNGHIRELERRFACSVDVDRISSARFRFTIHHQSLLAMDLAAIHIRAMVRQSQCQYVMAFVQYLAEPLGTETFPSFQSFASLNTQPTT